MNKLLTFELDDESEKIEIHVNKEGAKYLVDLLNDLSHSEENEHHHLMSPSWGGNELTEEKQNENSRLIKHIKVMFWK